MHEPLLVRTYSRHFNQCFCHIFPQFSLPFFRGMAEAPLHCAHLPNPSFHFKGNLVDLRLRASNEHILIVRVLRARRAPGHSLLILLRPRVARAQKIISLHPLHRGGSVSTEGQPGHPSPPTTASIPCSVRPSAQPTAPIYLPSDEPYPLES